MAKIPKPQVALEKNLKLTIQKAFFFVQLAKNYQSQATQQSYENKNSNCLKDPACRKQKEAETNQQKTAAGTMDYFAKKCSLNPLCK